MKQRINNERVQELIRQGWQYTETNPGQRIVNGTAYYHRRGISSWQLHQLPQPECNCVTDWQSCSVCRAAAAKAAGDEIPY